MKTTCDYLAAIGARFGISSDYGLAAKLGITRQSLSHYRNGKSTFSDEVAIRAADLLDLPRHDVYLHIQAERAAKQENRDVHAVLCEAIRRLGGMAAALLLAFSMPSDTWALSQNLESKPISTTGELRPQFDSNTDYANWRKLKNLILLPFAFAINFFTGRTYHYAV